MNSWLIFRLNWNFGLTRVCSIKKTEKPCSINNITTMIIKQIWEYPHQRKQQQLLNHMHVDGKHWTLFYVAVWSYKIYLENGRNVTYLWNASYWRVIYSKLYWQDIDITFVKVVQQKLECDVTENKICRRLLYLPWIAMKITMKVTGIVFISYKHTG
jgi:hypothetical protein